jgi:prolyl oligopeptidase PreP (S9A serine peptidase family)
VKRKIVYDDFTAVANDLFAKKITSPRRLGIQGGSNSSLLMGVQFTQDENTEGGHGVGADLKQAARTTALTMTHHPREADELRAGPAEVASTQAGLDQSRR